MKKNRLITLALLLSGAIFSTAANAQDGAADLVQAGADAGKLTEAYLAPIFKGFGIGLNSGWANTAHSKNMGRFDLRLSVTAAQIPTKDETFNVTSIGLTNNLRLKAGQSAIAPTVSGEKTIGPIVELYNGNSKVREFNLPQGAKVPFVPAPQLQASVGLIKGIEVSVRAIPQINLGDVGSLNMIGGGIKVEVLPLIAGKTASKLLPFDVAVALGYTQFSYKKKLDYKSPDGTTMPDNQTIEAKISGINTQLILSKTLLVFTPFISVGLNSSKTDGGLKGSYRVATSAVAGIPVYNTVQDPVTIDKKNFSSFRSDLGFQLNLAIFRLYASYSVSEYNSFNAGIGLGIGK
ncbi:MAG: hypothetical protein H7Y07_11035 [Pyrinomonadaceae bacterium]|nr:hypothetical protein [Sphingobacteriaceae bacterium]